jgi:protein tyrosine/serine phosphatase
MIFRLPRLFHVGPLLLTAATTLAPVHAAEPARPSEWAEPISKASNLYRVTPTFFRSARLGKDDVARAKSLGIKTVVSLRSFHSDRSLLKGSGIKTIRVRINTWDIDDQQVVEALRAIRAAEKDGPVLLHCLHGADRTGLIAAMYRMLYQGWTKKQALHELQNGGYGYHAIWTNIEKYLHKVDVAQIRQRVEQANP